ncbi:YihY family inner membrane protein [Myxococcota bacterium]|nr:YihY family inner membrane protein [Myxococcota bacterium]
MATSAARPPLARLQAALQRLRREGRAALDEDFSGDRPIPLGTRLAAGVRLLFDAIARSDIMTRASALSFSFVLSLIPLLSTSLAFFTAFPALAEQRRRLEALIYSQLLPGAVAEAQRYIDRFSQRAAAAGAVSTALFVVFVLVLFKSVEDTFNQIWTVERGRTWGERLQALAVFFTSGALAALALVILDNAANDLAGRLGTAGGVGREAWLGLGSLAVAWTAFTVANKVLPNTHVRWAPALVGGLVAGTIWHLTKSGFTWYVGNVADYESVYGTLGLVPAFFLWVLLSFLSLLFAGYTAFVAQNVRPLALLRQTAKRQQPHAFYAVAAVATLARAFRDGQGALAADEVAARLGAADYFVLETLPCLVKHGLVLAIPGDVQRYALARPSETVTVQHVVDSATGEELALPEGEGRTALHRRLGTLFREARSREGNALAKVTIAELVDDAPIDVRAVPADAG